MRYKCIVCDDWFDQKDLVKVNIPWTDIPMRTCSDECANRLKNGLKDLNKGGEK